MTLFVWMWKSMSWRSMHVHARHTPHKYTRMTWMICRIWTLNSFVIELPRSYLHTIHNQTTQMKRAIGDGALIHTCTEVLKQWIAFNRVTYLLHVRSGSIEVVMCASAFFFFWYNICIVYTQLTNMPRAL